MSKYIDADKLIAEIERLHKAHSGKYGCDEVGLNLEYLEDFIDSLQQEQPVEGLAEEISRTYHDGSVADTDDMDHNDYENIARHFYELGLNSKK